MVDERDECSFLKAGIDVYELLTLNILKCERTARDNAEREALRLTRLDFEGVLVALRTRLTQLAGPTVH